MDSHEETLAVAVPVLCRRCTRLLSRRLSDVPGVSALRVDTGAGRAVVHGRVDPTAVAAVLAQFG